MPSPYKIHVPEMRAAICFRFPAPPFNCYSSCHSSLRVLGQFVFVSVDVALSRGGLHRRSRQISENVGKALKRNGGDDGARTRDLRRNESAFADGFDRLISITCGAHHVRAPFRHKEPPAASLGRVQHLEKEP
jgi:hypothetical protein